MRFSKRPAIVIFAVLLAFPFAGLDVTLTPRTAGAAVTLFGGVGFPGNITSGPDGALWFSSLPYAIGRITTAGTVTSYTDPTVMFPAAITVGPDGALWFTNLGPDTGGSFKNGSIGRITTSGAITNYTDPSFASSSYLAGITTGPDGALWFTNSSANSIGRITTAGTITIYTDPSISGPGAITAGPDGALWFVNRGSNSIGRITTAGTVTTYTDSSITGPADIAAGPDGALWFTNTGVFDPTAENWDKSSIGRITTTGTITHYTAHSIVDPIGITAGADGALWFTMDDSNVDVAAGFAGFLSIGRIKTSGIVSNYIDDLDASHMSTGFIAAGPDRALWFTNQDNSGRGFSSIGRITTDTRPDTVPGAPHVASAVPHGNGQVRLTWRAPASDGGAGIWGYAVTPYLGSVAQPAWNFNERFSPGTTHTITGLRNGKTYRFKVAARNQDGAGARSSLSAAVTVGAPGPPATPKITKTAPGSVSVVFVAPPRNGAPITKYTVACTSSNHGAAKANTGTASPIFVTGLTGSKTYTCRVTATNRRGTGPPSVASAPIKA